MSWAEDEGYGAYDPQEDTKARSHMDTSFELNKLDYFTPQNVELIEDFEPDQYGNRWHNVKFQGDAETYMWLAKNTPEEGKKYYGHIEKTKSGKRLRFKTDKQPETAVQPAGAKSGWQPKDERQITRNMVWKNLLGHYDVQSMEPDSEQWQHFWAGVDLHTEMLLPKTSGSLGAVPTPSPTIKETMARPSDSAADDEPTIKDKLNKGWSEDDEIH